MIDRLLMLLRDLFDVEITRNEARRRLIDYDKFRQCGGLKSGPDLKRAAGRGENKRCLIQSSPGE